MKGNKKGWRRRAITRSCGEKHNLESLDGYWIKPKKLSLDVMQQITAGQGLDIDPDELKDKTEDEVKAIIEATQLEKGKKLSLNDENFQNMLKLTFVHGVGDHNFDDIFDTSGNEVTREVLDGISDDDFALKIEKGEFVIKKVSWDVVLYEKMREFTEVLFEIFKVVMAFNRPLPPETSEKSAT